MDVVLAVDIGGTKSSVLVQTRDGAEIGRQIIATRPDDCPGTLDEITEAAQLLIGSHQLVAVGVGAAGVIEDGVLVGSGNLPGWAGYDLQMRLRRAFGVPVIILNDAQAAGLGEYAELGRPLIYVIWGTGVGATIVVVHNGRSIALATELGHIVIDKNSRLKCGCGGYGHLEALVSGGNIPKRRFGWRRGRRAEHLKNRHWETVLRDMAVGLRSLCTSAPGAPIVMGGGVATKQRHRIPRLQQLVGALQSSCAVPELLLAKHGEDSGLIGAAHAAWQLVA
jgi:glucokinase